MQLLYQIFFHAGNREENRKQIEERDLVVDILASFLKKTLLDMSLYLRLTLLSRFVLTCNVGFKTK